MSEVALVHTPASHSQPSSTAWPYSYDTCDIGTLANQTDPTTGGPTAAITSGTTGANDALFVLPQSSLSPVLF